MTTTIKKDPHPTLTQSLQAEPDLVDRIFDYLVLTTPKLKEALDCDIDKAKAAVRDEFGGDKAYVRAGKSAAKRTEDSKEKASRALALFNGRNASEVARELGIGRSTVYRLLKQAGRR